MQMLQHMCGSATRLEQVVAHIFWILSGAPRQEQSYCKSMNRIMSKDRGVGPPLQLHEPTDSLTPLCWHTPRLRTMRHV